MSTITTNDTPVSAPDTSSTPVASNPSNPSSTANAAPVAGPAPAPAPAPLTTPAPDPSVPAASPSPLPAPPPLPPGGAVIPTPPAGFTPVKGGVARGVRPRKAESVVMPDAVVELGNFLDWQATLGKAAPNQADMVATFDSANQWSVMRAATSVWGTYCSNEEGVAWTGVRAFMAIVKPLLDAAVTADPTIATTYPKLCALFSAKSSIAKKAVSTKAANKKDAAEGKPMTHGEVGRKQQKAAAKAALAAQQAAEAAATTAREAVVSTTSAVTTASASNVGNGESGSNGVTHA